MMLSLYIRSRVRLDVAIVCLSLLASCSHASVLQKVHENLDMQKICPSLLECLHVRLA